jgi:parallel beta-helix repeat protein
MKVQSSTALLLSALGLTWSLLPLADAQGRDSSSLACGAVITHDVALAHDLTGCSASGLVVGADGVTINLEGHQIRGDGVAGTNQTDIGILIDGHRGVRVADGSIARFHLGVLLFGGSSDIRVSQLQISGIAGKAIILSSASDNTITDNTLKGNSDAGIGVFDGADHNLISRNYLSHDGPQGIENVFANANTITRNRITHTGSGVILESSDSLRITYNRIVHSMASACDGCGIAVQVYGTPISLRTTN